MKRENEIPEFHLRLKLYLHADLHVDGSGAFQADLKICTLILTTFWTRIFSVNVTI